MQKYGAKYREVNASNINNVGLPATICCKVCKKNKVQAQFSNKQLNDLKYKVYKSGSGISVGGTIRCRTCTGSQTTELRCSCCEAKKSLSEFALNQRNKPDSARCVACQEDTLYIDPDNRDFKIGHLGEEGHEDADSDDQSMVTDLSDNYEMDINGDYMTESEGGITVPSSRSSRTSTRKSTTASQSMSSESGLKLTKGNLASFTKDTGSNGYYGTSRPESESVNSTLRSASTAAWHAFAKGGNTIPGNSLASWSPQTPGTKENNEDDSWQTAGKKGGSGAQARKPPMMYTAYDANGAKYQRTHTPSTVDTSDLAESFDEIAIGTRARGRNENPRSFPRVRPQNPLRPRRTPLEDNMIRVARLEADSDSDSDDD